MTTSETRFSAVVLAAGTSSRMQGRNKLLLPVAGEPAIRRTVTSVLGAQPQEVVVVTGYQGVEVAAALQGLPIELLANPRFEEGQMTSVAAGIAALTRATDAVMVCLGDMVLLTSADYRELAGLCVQQTEKSIVVPRYRGQRGNPVVIAAWRIPEILIERPNLGCRKFIDDHPQDVLVHESPHDRVIADMDTPEDFARICARMGADWNAHEERVA